MGNWKIVTIGASGGGADPGTYFAVIGADGTNNGTWTDTNRCNSIIVDDDYNVYSGWTVSSNNSYQGILLMQDANGAVQFKKNLTISNSTNYNSVRGMAFDDSGRIHIFGCQSPSYSNGLGLSCHSASDGSKIYGRGISDPEGGTPENGNDSFMTQGLQLTSDGKLALGFVNQISSSDNRINTMLLTPGSSSYTVNRAGKYEFQGGTNTTRGNGLYFVSSYDNKSWTCGDVVGRNGIAAFDASGGTTGSFGISYYRGYAVFLHMSNSTGNWYWANTFSSESGQYLYLMKYTASGTYQWTRRMGPASSSSYVNTIDSYFGGAWEDSNGDVYWSVKGSNSNQFGGQYESMTMVFKFNSSGTLQWSRRFWLYNNSSFAASIYGDPTDAGAIYITTRGDNPFFVKYPKDGSVTGNWTLGGRTLYISSDVGLSVLSTTAFNNISSGAYNPDFESTNVTPGTSGGSFTVSNLSQNPKTALNLT